MSVIIGEVETFPATHADKEQVLKIGEECMEVFSAWEDWQNDNCSNYCKDGIVYECADVIQAVCNLLDALGVDDMRCEMKACEQRNRDRGRFDTERR